MNGVVCKPTDYLWFGDAGRQWMDCAIDTHSKSGIQLWSRSSNCRLQRWTTTAAVELWLLTERINKQYWISTFSAALHRYLSSAYCPSFLGALLIHWDILYLIHGLIVQDRTRVKPLLCEQYPVVLARKGYCIYFQSWRLYHTKLVLLTRERLLQDTLAMELTSKLFLSH